MLTAYADNDVDEFAMIYVNAAGNTYIQRAYVCALMHDDMHDNVVLVAHVVTDN